MSVSRTTDSPQVSLGSVVVWAFAFGLLGCGPRPTGETTDYEPYEPPEPTTLECSPDLDGQLERQELDPALGVEANYIVSAADETRMIDLAGEPAGDGRKWDWSHGNESDRERRITAEPVEGKWYADAFPDGEFRLPLDLSGRVDAIYRMTDDAMLLLGTASTDESPDTGKTLLPYEEPVEVYRFPLESGDQWRSVGRVEDGTLRGAPYAGEDVYRVRVRETGEMELPNFTFDKVHRVDTEVTLSPSAGDSVSYRQVSFLAECFGEVARARSKDGVTATNFDEATEVRRLGVPRSQNRDD